MQCKLTVSKPNLLVNLEELKKNEINRRRILRLQQVRQQSKDIARKLRQSVQNERDRQLTLFEKEERARERHRRATRLLSLQQQYEESLNDIGNSHKVAALQPDEKTIHNLQWQQDRSLAFERARVAAEQLRLQKEKLKESQKNIMNLKEKQQRYSRNLDDLRTATATSNKKAHVLETDEKQNKQQPLKEVHDNICTEQGTDKSEQKKTHKENKRTVKNNKIERGQITTNTKKTTRQVGSNILPLNKQLIRKEKLIVPKYVPLVKQQQPVAHDTTNINKGQDHSSRNEKQDYSSRNKNKENNSSVNVTKKSDNPKNLVDEGKNPKNKPSVSKSVKVTCPPCPWKDGRGSQHISKASPKKTVCPPCPFKSNVDTLPDVSSVVPESTLENDDELQFDDRRPWQDLENELETDVGLGDNHLDRNGDNDIVKDVGEKVDENTQSTSSSKSRIESCMSHKEKVQLYDHRLRYEKQVEKECMVETITDTSGPSAIETAREAEAQSERDMKERTENLKRLEVQCQDRGQKAIERERVIRDSRQLFSNLGELLRQEKQLQSTNALRNLKEVHLLDRRRKAHIAMKQKQMDTMFENIWHSVYSTNVQKTNLPTPVIQKDDVNSTPPATLNVAEYNSTSAHSPEKISTSISKDEEALKQLMERVRIQRALLYDEIGEHLHIPANERFSSVAPDARDCQPERVTVGDDDNKNQQNVIKTSNMEDSVTKSGKVADEPCECGEERNDVEDQDFSSLNVERDSLTCQSTISLDMSVSKVTEHEEITSTSSSSTTNTTTVCEGVKIVVNVQEISGSVFHTFYKSPHLQKVKITSSPKKLKMSSKEHKESAKISPHKAEKEVLVDVHATEENIEAMVDNRQTERVNFREDDAVYRVCSPAAWSEPCSSSTSYYSPPYYIHRINKQTKSKNIPADDNSTKTSYLSPPPAVISDHHMDSVDRIVTIIQEQKVKLDEVLSEMTGRKHMEDKDIQVSVDLEQYIKRLLLMSRASVEKLNVTLSDSQSSSPLGNRITPQHLASPRNIEKCKCDETNTDEGRIDQISAAEVHPIPQDHHIPESKASDLPSPHSRQIQSREDKSTFVDINREEFSQSNSNIRKPDYCFCSKKSVSHKQPSYNLSSLETTTVLNKQDTVTLRPDSCFCPPVYTGDSHSHFPPSQVKPSHVPYHSNVYDENTHTDKIFHRPSLSEIIRDLSLDDHKIRKFPEWHDECQDISKRFISRIASLSEEIEQIRQEKLKFQKTSQMISHRSADVSQALPKERLPFSVPSPNLSPSDDSVYRAPVSTSFDDSLCPCPFPVSNLVDFNVLPYDTTLHDSDLCDSSVSHQKQGKTSWREVLSSSGNIQTSEGEIVEEYLVDSEDIQQIYFHKRRPPPSRNDLVRTPTHELSTIIEVDTPQASATKKVMESDTRKETDDQSLADPRLHYSSHDETDDTLPNVIEEMIRRRLITSPFPVDDLSTEESRIRDISGEELLSSQESLNLDHFINISHVCTEACKFSTKHKNV